MKIEVTGGASTSENLINRRGWFNMNDVCLARELITDCRRVLLSLREQNAWIRKLSSIHCRLRRLRVAKDGDGGRRARRWRRKGRTRRGNDDDNGGGDADANQICHLYLMSAVMKSLFACEQNAENANWEMGVRDGTRRDAQCSRSPFFIIIFSLKHEYAGEGWHPLRRILG